MSLKSQLIQLTNEFGLVFARFGTAEYCEATLMVFRLGTKVDKDPGASSLPSVQTATLLNACITHVDLGRMSRFSPWSRPYGPAFDYWVPINKQANSYTLWMSLSSKWQLSQQRHAVARDTIPRRKSVTEAAIQLLSAVLGSVAAVAAAVFGLEDAVTVVLVTVVLVVMLVLGDVAAGFTAGSVVDPVPGCSAAGPAPPSGLPAPPPGTSPPSVSPAGGVATSGSITTCGASAPVASTTPPASKVPPAGATNRADTSDPPVHATPPSAPAASSHEASTESRQPAGPSPVPASCRNTP